MKTSVIQHAKKDPFVMIRNGYKELCGGDTCKAAVLAVVEFWMNGAVRGQDANGGEKSEEDETSIKLPENKLILLGRRSKPDWEKAMIGLYSVKWIKKAVRSLVDCGILVSQTATGRTSVYWANPRRIQQAIDYCKNKAYDTYDKHKDPLSQIAHKLGWGASDYSETDLKDAFSVSKTPKKKYRVKNTGEEKSQGNQEKSDVSTQANQEKIPHNPEKITRILGSPPIYDLRRDLEVEEEIHTQDLTRTDAREKNPDLCVCVKSERVTTNTKEPETVQAHVEVVQPEPETRQTDNQNNQVQFFPDQNKKNLGEDQGSGACDNKEPEVFGIPVARLEEIGTKFDRGEIYTIPDRELKALAQLRIGAIVKLYRQSGMIGASKPNDISLEFAKWLAWHQWGQEGEIQRALNTIAKYERLPDKWQVLVTAIQQWQEFKANPELIERKVSQRQRSTNSEIDKEIQVRKVEQVAQQIRARKAAKTSGWGNVPEATSTAVVEPQNSHTDNAEGKVQTQDNDLSSSSSDSGFPPIPNSSPMPDSLRDRLAAIRSKLRIKYGAGSCKHKPSVVPVRPVRPVVDYGGFDF